MSLDSKAFDYLDAGQYGRNEKIIKVVTLEEAQKLEEDYNLLVKETNKLSHKLDEVKEIVLKFCAECDWKDNCDKDTDECKIYALLEVLK